LWYSLNKPTPITDGAAVWMCYDKAHFSSATGIKECTETGEFDLYYRSNTMKDNAILPSWITKVVSDNTKIQIAPVSADLLGYTYTISTIFKPTFGTV